MENEWRSVEGLNLRLQSHKTKLNLYNMKKIEEILGDGILVLAVSVGVSVKTKFTQTPEPTWCGLGRCRCMAIICPRICPYSYVRGPAYH